MILDSGERRSFESGAVRDIVEGKGRCDLLPLREITKTLMEQYGNQKARILDYIDIFRETGDVFPIYEAIKGFIDLCYKGDSATAILELAVHYEEGAKKYVDRNWEKGINLHCFVDSGMRHYLKWLRGDKDENHERAFLWNMYGLLWTYEHHPELDDFVCKETKRSGDGEEDKS